MAFQLYDHIYLDQNELLAVPRYQHKVLPLYGMVNTGKEDERYEIQDILHYGEFGDIYRVRNTKSRQYHQLRTELVSPPETHQQYEALAALFQEFLLRDNGKQLWRFPTVVNAGQDDDFKFLVTKTLGRTVHEVRRYYVKKNFTAHDALHVITHMYFAIEYLHQLGYVHGDLSIRSFCFGEGENENNVYMYLFGRLRKAREEGRFAKERPGPIYYNGQNNTFCPRTAHKRQDFCRRDDLESWLYISADVFMDGNPPWRRCNKTRNQQIPEPIALQCKEQFFQGGEKITNDFFEDTPKEMKALVPQIDALAFDHVPNYDAFRGVLTALREKLPQGKAPKWAGHSRTNVYPGPKRPTVKATKKKSKKKKGNQSREQTEDEEDEEEESQVNKKRKKKSVKKSQGKQLKRKASRENVSAEQEEGEEEDNYININLLRKAVASQEEADDESARKAKKAKRLKGQSSYSKLGGAGASSKTSMMGKPTSISGRNAE